MPSARALSGLAEDRLADAPGRAPRGGPGPDPGPAGR
jgi:hypothetical protein